VASCSGSVVMRLSKIATSRWRFLAGLHRQRPLATQQQRRREGLSYFIWIVAFERGLETSHRSLIYHPE